MEMIMRMQISAIQKTRKVEEYTNYLAIIMRLQPYFCFVYFELFKLYFQIYFIFIFIAIKSNFSYLFICSTGME